MVTAAPEVVRDTATPLDDVPPSTLRELVFRSALAFAMSLSFLVGFSAEVDTFPDAPDVAGDATMSFVDVPVTLVTAELLVVRCLVPGCAFSWLAFAFLPPELLVAEGGSRTSDEG